MRGTQILHSGVFVWSARLEKSWVFVWSVWRRGHCRSIAFAEQSIVSAVLSPKDVGKRSRPNSRFMPGAVEATRMKKLAM